MKRTLIIGDIHGAYQALLQVLERSKYNPNTDTLVFLGDYTDGWGETIEVLNKIIELQKEGEVISILGNHDVWLLEYLKFRVAPNIWKSQGGDIVYKRWLRFFMDDPVLAQETSAKHIAFLKGCHYYYEYEKDGINTLFVHAGYTKSPKKDDRHNLLWTRDMANIAMGTRNSQKPKRFKLYDKIFIGHTATTSWNTDQPIIGHNVYNVDTGAGFSGRLTCYCLETDEFWQSDLTKKLYPKEYGR